MVEVGSVVAVLEKRVADGVIDADLELEVDLVLTDDELDDELTSASAPAPAEETEGMVEFPVRLLKLGASLFKIAALHVFKETKTANLESKCTLSTENLIIILRNGKQRRGIKQLNNAIKRVWLRWRKKGITTRVWDQLKDLRGRRRAELDTMRPSKLVRNRASRSLTCDEEILFLDHDSPRPLFWPDGPVKYYIGPPKCRYRGGRIPAPDVFTTRIPGTHHFRA